MTHEEQRICIAEACGWTNIDKPLKANEQPWGFSFTNKQWCYPHQLPDYLNDLNAMQSAVLSQSIDFQRRFQTAMSYRSSRIGKMLCQLLASDWAEEFLTVKRDMAETQCHEDAIQ